MKVLFISAIKIEANASAGAETVNIYINEFSKLGVQVDVVAGSQGRYKGKHISYHVFSMNSGSKLIEQVQKLLGWVFYPQNKYLYKTRRSIRKTMLSMLNKMKDSGYDPDVIILETTSVLLLYKEIKKLYPDAVMVASMHDIAYQGSERKMGLEVNKVKYLVRSRYLKYAKLYEIQAMAAADLIVPHNKENIQWLKKEPELAKKIYFPLVPYYETGFQHNDHTLSRDLLFYGLMSRPENYESALWFIRYVMCNVPNNYRFIIMGANPPECLLKCQSEQIIITGFVAEDQVKQYFEKAMCFVSPLRFGSGIKTKVLSALSAGLPVLTNKIGIEGITAENQVSYIHCETADDYRNAILEISENRNYYYKLCLEAKKVTQDGYNHQECAKQYLSLLRQIRREK